MHRNLLVVLSLLVMPYASPGGDKHKQPAKKSGRASGLVGKTWMGRFIARAYAPTGRKTAGGNEPVEGKTIAADPEILPMGSRVRISGVGPYSGVYHVDDVGSDVKGKKVDIFVGSREEAIQFGRREVQLTLLSGSPRARARAIIVEDEARRFSAYPIGRSVAP